MKLLIRICYYDQYKEISRARILGQAFKIFCFDFENPDCQFWSIFRDPRFKNE